MYAQIQPASRTNTKSKFLRWLFVGVTWSESSEYSVANRFAITAQKCQRGSLDVPLTLSWLQRTTICRGRVVELTAPEISCKIPVVKAEANATKATYLHRFIKAPALRCQSFAC